MSSYAPEWPTKHLGIHGPTNGINEVASHPIIPSIPSPYGLINDWWLMIDAPLTQHPILRRDQIDLKRGWTIALLEGQLACKWGFCFRLDASSRKSMVMTSQSRFLLSNKLITSPTHARRYYIRWVEWTGYDRKCLKHTTRRPTIPRRMRFHLNSPLCLNLFLRIELTS